MTTPTSRRPDAAARTFGVDRTTLVGDDQAMGLRIHFTVEDLARTRIDPSPRPLLELSIALRLLQTRDHPVRYGAWRREVATRLPHGARKVLDLVPVRGWTPDFISFTDSGDVDSLVDKLRSLSRRQVSAELAEISEQQTLPAWSRELADDPRGMNTFLDTLAHLHQAVLGPWWPQLRSRITADQAVRARIMTSGLDALLAGLSPKLRWKAPVLEILSPCDDDVYLQGRGLVLVPTAFALLDPVIAPTTLPQPILTYAAADPAPLRDLATFTPHPLGHRGTGRHSTPRQDPSRGPAHHRRTPRLHHEGTRIPHRYRPRQRQRTRQHLARSQTDHHLTPPQHRPAHPDTAGNRPPRHHQRTAAGHVTELLPTGTVPLTEPKGYVFAGQMPFLLASRPCMRWVDPPGIWLVIKEERIKRPSEHDQVPPGLQVPSSASPREDPDLRSSP
ncbi:hypothetical protein QFZ43_000178 [Streptomyces afghaniensis]|nr:hypothetical protein [Streptomyces afghaniensis]